VADPPSLSCGPEIFRATLNTAGVAVTFDLPTASQGQGSVTVSCAPQSGTEFPPGTTPVTCTAVDALSRTASCTFSVTVVRVPQLSRTQFLAFGDSITAGEVTVPVGAGGRDLIVRQVVVPAASYPSVLLRTLQGRYSLQSDALAVANFGLGGERAINARNRFFGALNTVRPEAVLLMEGYNDIPGGQDGAASGAAAEIRAMAAEARLRGMRVFIATLAPPRPGGSRAIGQIYVDDYNSRMRAVASQEGAVLVDVYGALLTDVQRYIGIDGLHPTEAGYARIADAFFQAIQGALEVR
jgi:lysophospholipase L1-like esterase